MRCWDLREGRQLQQHDFSSQVLPAWRTVAPPALPEVLLSSAGQGYLSAALSVFIIFTLLSL